MKRMVEPFAVGMQAAVKARITPGDIAIVLGAGTIGIMIALAALAGGCSKVLITDVHQPKLDIAGRYDGIVPVNISREDAKQKVLAHTEGSGANIVFEASGASKALASLISAGLAAPSCSWVFRSTRTHLISLARSTRRSRFAPSSAMRMYLIGR